MADRLSIDKKVNDTVIQTIEKKRFLRLDKSNIDRIDLFLFALAVGVQKGQRTPLESTHGFVLESAFAKNGGPMSGIYSLNVQEMIKCNEEEKISDKDTAYKIAQEYANTGFREIGKWLQEDEETRLYALLAEMDEKYEELFPED